MPWLYGLSLTKLSVRMRALLRVSIVSGSCDEGDRLRNAFLTLVKLRPVGISIFR